MSLDAIVIGAGFAGLSAATLLAERGRRVLVLEARSTLGGRATAFTDPATGERVDNGQHVLFGCYHETFRFLRRIGAESHVRVQPDLVVDVIDRDGHASRLRCPRLPSPLHLLAGVMTWNALGWRDRNAVLKIGAALRRTVKVRPASSRETGLASSNDSMRGGPSRSAETSRETDPTSSNDSMRGGPSRSAETVRAWLVRHGQTPRLIELLWEPLAVAALNQQIDVAAAAPFAAILKQMFGPGARDASLALPVKPLDEMYALPAQAFIEKHGGTVKTGTTARIKGSIVETRDEQFVAPAVICAVPWYALADTLVDPPPALAAVVEAARNTSASPIVTVNLWFDRIVTDRPFVGLPGRTMQWVFDKRAVFGEQASHLSLVSSGAESVVAQSNGELIALAVREITDALPAARGATVTRAVVVREKRATFSVAPGQPPRPGTRTAVPGLFLAGDWIETGLPATIEGAVLSGHAAAEAALNP